MYAKHVQTYTQMGRKLEAVTSVWVDREDKFARGVTGCGCFKIYKYAYAVDKIKGKFWQHINCKYGGQIFFTGYHRRLLINVIIISHNWDII